MLKMSIRLAEPAGEIDVPRARAALQRAEGRLRGAGEPGHEPVDRDRAMRALERARNRLALAIAERA